MVYKFYLIWGLNAKTPISGLAPLRYTFVITVKRLTTEIKHHRGIFVPEFCLCGFLSVVKNSLPINAKGANLRPGAFALHLRYHGKKAHHRDKTPQRDFRARILSLWFPVSVVKTHYLSMQKAPICDLAPLRYTFVITVKRLTTEIKHHRGIFVPEFCLCGFLSVVKTHYLSMQKAPICGLAPLRYTFVITVKRLTTEIKHHRGIFVPEFCLCGFLSLW